ncbi:MAG TPA: glycoside hydrolase family 16 protein [Tepidisphaeraceae bacterium]|jgi:beta-glucanase (GH16 family)|nr:glycoside hydrolase family 16 protein [Tepidisphaeraceae bacterium]
MRNLFARTALAVLSICLMNVVPVQADEVLPLVEVTDLGAVERFTTTPQVTLVKRDGGVAVTVAPGDEGYPGVKAAPAEGKTWDLSQFGRVEAKITNVGTKTVNVTLRVDDDGDWKTNPWNGENVSVKPGESGTVKVIFGHSWGYKPAHKLNAAKVVSVQLFTGKVKEPIEYRIDSLVATGPAGEKPPEKGQDPSATRTKPTDGHILGNGATLDASKQLAVKGGAAAEAVDGSAVRVTFPAGKKDAVASVKPVVGRWDLTDYLQVNVELQNAGQSAVSPRVRLESNNGATDWLKLDPIAPGATAQVAVPFGGKVWDGNIGKESGNKFASDATSGVAFAPQVDGGAQSLVVKSVSAVLPPAPELPSWVNNRPPTEGDWKLTFEDTFDGTQIDTNKWNLHTENFWDKRTYFSRDNVIVKDGQVHLRYEKRTVHKNDSGTGDTRDYVCGFLDAYGKWAQRYGYFEARVKLPTAPGLWPAFWTMPDRGADKGPQWVRASTEKGGMELDIMEHLTRWGPYRYNVAHHWDGYGDKHKSNGTSWAYFQPDKDGFVNAAVLWLPGSTTYYANGQIIGKWEDERVGSVESYPILYMVSGGWDNNRLDDAQLPADFVVDYIRVWQRADLASDVDSAPMTGK